ncbi:MAG: chemotaxis protein CheX [Bdellovibrionales bacterium]|nr:chemotaxis protein CheX [Bdellovibrionales bacterium]
MGAEKLDEEKVATKLDGDFLNPFISATKNVLQTQANTDLSAGKPYIKRLGDVDALTEIAGVISLTCEQFKGSIAVCFNSEVFLNIYENMVGEKHEEITEDVQDAAGEILNIIFGQAKTVLKGKNYVLERAIPTVLVGEKLRIRYKSKIPTIVIPFETKTGTFHIEIIVDLDN